MGVEEKYESADVELGRAKAIDVLKTAKAFLAVVITENGDAIVPLGGDRTLIPRLLEPTLGALKMMAQKNMELHEEHLTMNRLAMEEIERLGGKVG